MRLTLTYRLGLPLALNVCLSTSLGTGQNALPLTDKSEATPAENIVLLSFHILLKSRACDLKKLHGSTHTGQTKPIKCSVLSVYFHFPGRLFITLHFFALLLYAEEMHWRDLAL